MLHEKCVLPNPNSKNCPNWPTVLKMSPELEKKEVQAGAELGQAQRLVDWAWIYSTLMIEA